MRTPTRNPFQHPDNPESAVRSVGPSDGAVGAPLDEVERVERVDKPWGHEEIFAVLEGQYIGKILHIRAGRALSLQQHRAKVETIAVQSGRIRVEHGPDPEHLVTITLGPGERLLIRAQVVHRITALSDSCVLEASTAQPGWRQDVVRIEDPYGRAGTSAP